MDNVANAKVTNSPYFNKSSPNKSAALPEEIPMLSATGKYFADTDIETGVSASQRNAKARNNYMNMPFTTGTNSSTFNGNDAVSNPGYVAVSKINETMT